MEGDKGWWPFPIPSPLHFSNSHCTFSDYLWIPFAVPATAAPSKKAPSKGAPSKKKTAASACDEEGYRNVERAFWDQLLGVEIRGIALALRDIMMDWTKEEELAQRSGVSAGCRRGGGLCSSMKRCARFPRARP